ncbi:M14 family zinc carboxypeptidase, partial [Acinetobacter baumannii]
QDFTSHAEVMGFLADLAARAPSMRLHVAGTSQGGRALPVVLLPSARGEADVSDAHRPTLLLIGQQHGNEPAGGEAMLVMAQRLAAGDL